MNRHFLQNKIVIRGAGEMASGVIRHLFIAGFDVIALERSLPTCVRRLVCFAEAFYKKKVTVEGLTAILVNSPEEVDETISNRQVPLLIDPEAKQLPALNPVAVIDARMLKHDIDTDFSLAPIVIGLGPGFIAGENCHAAIETNRGADLGRIFYTGHPQADTGVPASINSFDIQRVLRSPADGEYISNCKITDRVKSGQILGQVAGVSVVAEIDGIVRGMIHGGSKVSIGQKIGDLDPRFIEERCYEISDKANAIGKGALEALMSLKTRLVQS